MLYLLDITGFVACILLYINIRYMYTLLSVYIFIFIISSVNTAYHVVFQGALPDLFTKKNLPNVNSFINSIESFLSALGPLLGVSISIMLGYESSILLNGLSFFISTIITIIFITALPIENKGKKVINMVKDGIKLTWQEPFIKFGVILFFFGNFSLNIFLAIFVYILKESMHATDMTVGIVFALGGVFSVLGSFLAHRISSLLNSSFLVLSSSTLLSGLLILPIAINNLYITILCFSGISFLGSVTIVIFFTERQKRVDKLILSRVVAVSRMISYLSIPIGAIFGGYIISIIPIALVLLISGLLRITTGAWAIIYSYKYK